MTYRDAVLELDNIRRTMYGVEAETAVNDLLDAIDSGDVESGDEESLDVLRGDIVTFMLTEMPYLSAPERGIYEYFSDPASSTESTEADALAMIEALQVKLRDELAIWERDTSAAAFEEFNARSGSPGFERGGFPVQQINVIRVKAQAQSMRLWISRRGNELRDAMYSLEDAAAADAKEVSSQEFLRVVQGLVDGVIDEWADIVAYADMAITEWQSDYREVWVMVNWKNTINQVAVGLVFSIIAVVVWKTFLGGLLKGTLGFLGKWGDDLARLRVRYLGMADDAAKGLVSQGQLDDAWRVLQQHERLSNANILRYGMPPTGVGELPVLAPRPTPTRAYVPPTTTEMVQTVLPGTAPIPGQMPLFPGLWDDAAKIADDAFQANPLIELSDEALSRLSKGGTSPFNLPGYEITPVLGPDDIPHSFKIHSTTGITDDLFVANPLLNLDDAALANMARGTSVPFNFPGQVVGTPPTGVSIDDLPNPFLGTQYVPERAGARNPFNIKNVPAAVLVAPTLGATAAINAFIESVENKMMERAMVVINEIIAPDVEEQGRELALTGGTEEEIIALVEKVMEDHRSEIELQLESLAEEIMMEEPMPEIPMDAEAGAELFDETWAARVESLYSLLSNVEDLGQFISINDMLNAELNNATTPDQQAYAEGVRAFASDLLDALRVRIENSNNTAE